MSAASCTVAMFSAPSSSSVMSNCSSSDIMISTVSSESAPRSTNFASGETLSSSAFSCWLMMLRTFDNVSSLCGARGDES